MTVMRTKKEGEYHSHNLEDLIRLLRSAIISLGSKSISRAKEEEVLQLLESLKIVILAKQARAESSTTI